MRRYTADVAVIGAGLAGMSAALAAREKGSDVLLLAKSPPGKGTCTSLAGGFFTAPPGAVERHREATFEAGRGLNDPRRVETVVSGAEAALDRLVRAGVPLRPSPRGRSVEEQRHPKEIPGVRLAERLAAAILARGVRPLTLHCLDLLEKDGRVAGLLGVTAAGEAVEVTASAVVLATGGAAALHPRHDNAAGLLGEGYAMALRAGCVLQDLEFIQFYPLGLAEPGLPETLLYPPAPPGAGLWDAEGADVLRELPGCEGLQDAIIRFRDTASLLFERKHRQGGLYLDLTKVEPSAWADLYGLRLLARTGFDFRRKPVRVAPIAHFSIGGVAVDEAGRTSRPGLYAAGEVAAGFHGANRLGGNALTECAVCGLLAGENAAEEAGRQRAVPSPLVGALPWPSPGVEGAQPAYRALFARARAVMAEQAGIVRTADGLRAGLGEAEGLEQQLKSLSVRGGADARRRAQAEAALLVLRCVLEASLLRAESRGAFFRADHPTPDDAAWRRNIRIRLDRATGALALKRGPLLG